MQRLIGRWRLTGQRIVQEMARLPIMSGVLVLGLAITLPMTRAALAVDVQSSPVQSSDAKARAEQAGQAKADARVKAALDQLKLKYLIDSDGDFRVTLGVGSQGRTQVVVIRSATEKVGDLEVRDIESPALITENDLTAAVANQLLIDSARKRLGAWQVIKGQKNHVVLFCSRIGATTDPATLQQVLLLTAISADGMEKALTGKDRF